MSLVFPDVAPPRDGPPQTHVLIVGVSHYVAFGTGGGQVGEVTLGQLTSPARSAKAFADWYIQDYNYPPAPLGSVELLLSERRASRFQGQAIEAATYPNFAAAVGRWADLGDNPDSRLIFVFCGHGFGAEGEASLLLADFDGRRRDCWNSALDLREFIAGLGEIPAIEQLFFVDACRKPHPAHLQHDAIIGTTPIQLRSADPRRGLPRRNAPVFFSTGADELAHAPVNGLSVFTTAFLRAMKGMAAGDEEGDWRVHNHSMLYAMDHVSRRLTQEAFPTPQQPQGTESRTFELHHLPRPPISPVYVERTDEGAAGDARIRYRRGGRTKHQPSRAEVREVEVELPPGDYTFELVDEGDRVISQVAQRSSPAFRKAKLP